MHKKITKIINFCRSKCPECQGILISEMYDMDHDMMVYKCQACDEEWC